MNVILLRYEVHMLDFMYMGLHMDVETRLSVPVGIYDYG